MRIDFSPLRVEFSALDRLVDYLEGRSHKAAQADIDAVNARATAVTGRILKANVKLQTALDNPPK